MSVTAFIMSSCYAYCNGSEYHLECDSTKDDMMNVNIQLFYGTTAY